MISVVFVEGWVVLVFDYEGLKGLWGLLYEFGY